MRPVIGGRLMKPAPVASSDEPTPTLARDAGVSDAVPVEIVAPDESELITDATDVFQLVVSPTGISAVDAAGNAITGISGAGTIASPLQIPFNGRGILWPNGAFAGLFVSRVGRGTNRWMPVLPGRPLRVQGAMLDFAVISIAGVISPAGLCSMEHYAKPSNESWAKHERKVKSSASGYGVPPFIPSAPSSAPKIATSTVVREVAGTGLVNQPVTPPAGTVTTDVTFDTDNASTIAVSSTDTSAERVVIGNQGATPPALVSVTFDGTGDILIHCAVGDTAIFIFHVS